MADQKITELVALTTPLAADLLAIVDIAGGTVTKKITFDNLIGGVSGFVTLDTAQTISGEKTFSGDQLFTGLLTAGILTAGGLLTANGGLQVNDYALPAADGSVDQVLQTDGAGVTSFVTLPAGVTTLAALTDVDLTGQAIGDLLFNVDGSNWEDTAGALRWDVTGFLELANANAINWLDASSVSQELLTLGPDTPIAWAAINTFSQIDSAEFEIVQCRSFTFNDDGTVGFVCTNTATTGGLFRSVTYGTPYVPSDTSSPTAVLLGTYYDMRFSADGLKVFLCNNITNLIEERANSGTAFNPVSGDLTSLTDTYSTSLNPRGLDIKADGTRMWVVSEGNTVQEVNFGTPFDLTTASDGNTLVVGGANFRSIRLSPDGLLAYLLDGNTIRGYALSVAFDITSALITGNNIDASTGSGGGGIFGFTVKEDGTTLIVQSQFGNNPANNDSIRWTSAGSGSGGAGSFIIGDAALKNQLEGVSTQIIDAVATLKWTGGQLTLNDYTFPAADGAADAVLTTDGLGVVSFASVGATPQTISVTWASSGSGSMTSVSGFSNTYQSGSVNKYEDNAALLFGTGSDVSLAFDAVNFNLAGIGKFNITGFDQLILPSVNDPVTPTFAFGDGDSGFFENADDSIQVALAGSAIFQFSGNAFSAVTINGPAFLNTNVAATTPNIIPDKNDIDTGIGQGAADQLSLIAGGVQVANLTELVGVVQMIVPLQNLAATPSIAFGDGDTGFYESADDVLQVSTAGTSRFLFTGDPGQFRGAIDGGATMLNELATATNPVFSIQGDANTGIGSGGGDQLSLIAGGVQVANLTELVGVVQLIVPLQNVAATPSIAFGDGNTGFYESVDNTLNVALAGVSQFLFTSGAFRGELDDGFSLRNEVATDTNPVYAFQGDVNTGIGRRTGDVGVLIAGARNVLEFAETAGAPFLGFFGTAAVARPTGVAVTAAGIHAALVTLGLITA